MPEFPLGRPLTPAERARNALMHARRRKGTTPEQVEEARADLAEAKLTDAINKFLAACPGDPGEERLARVRALLNPGARRGAA
jgi:hypothetical protein